jgi:hypothetical protein
LWDRKLGQQREPNGERQQANAYGDQPVPVSKY